MDTELTTILSENKGYREAYEGFLELHKQRHHSTPEELAEFEKAYEKDFLNGIKKDSAECKVLIKGRRLTIRRACIADSDFMSAAELEEDNSPWIGHWPLGWRIARFGDDNFLQTMIEKENGAPVGFIIFCDMADRSEKIRLKRIVITEKGKGYGKEALYLAQRLAFDIFGTKYLYLSTKKENFRAQSVYKAAGFVPDKPDPCTRFHLSMEDYNERGQEVQTECL